MFAWIETDPIITVEMLTQVGGSKLPTQVVHLPAHVQCAIEVEWFAIYLCAPIIIVDFYVLSCLEFSKQRPVAGKCEPKLGFITEKMPFFTIIYSLFYLSSSSCCAQVEFQPCLMVVNEAIIDERIGKFREAGPRLILNGCWLVDSLLFAHAV